MPARVLVGGVGIKQCLGGGSACSISTKELVICHETAPATAVAVMVIVLTLVHNSNSSDGAGMVLVEQDVTLLYG